MEQFKASFINRLYFRYFFHFLTNNIKHVNMYLYLYITIRTKDQRQSLSNSEMQAGRESRATSRDKQVCALKKIRLSFFRIYIVVNIFVPSHFLCKRFTNIKQMIHQFKSVSSTMTDISIFMPVLFRNRHLLNKKTLKQAKRCTQDIV